LDRAAGAAQRPGIALGEDGAPAAEDADRSIVPLLHHRHAVLDDAGDLQVQTAEGFGEVGQHRARGVAGDDEAADPGAGQTPGDLQNPSGEGGAAHLAVGDGSRVRQVEEAPLRIALPGLVVDAQAADPPVEDGRVGRLRHYG